MFVSTYEGAIDAKGRVSIPAPFRAALGGSARVFLWPAPDGSGALEGGGEELMELYRETLAELPLQSPIREAIVTCIIAAAADLKIDDTGRVKLPEDLCEAAELKDKIRFSGQLDSFRIWNPEQYRRHQARMRSVVNVPETLDAFAQAYNRVRQRRAASGRSGEGV
ncbi:division/cell wall cluster transcriptional repressor MraZ [Hyphomonas sp.]|uniref:division/cell wall cluster transcriptional repressor MraZ n=1 Tax=Hyphomonas sp. TaxID=87 RepID=UPI0039197758